MSCISKATLCEAEHIEECVPNALLVPALIAVFSKIAGMAIDCPTLISEAMEFKCVPANLQLPALLVFAQQMALNGVGPQGPAGPTGATGPQGPPGQGGGSNTLNGNGPPNGVSGVMNQLYWDSSNFIMYINTNGSNAWQAI